MTNHQNLQIFGHLDFLGDFYGLNQDILEDVQCRLL